MKDGHIYTAKTTPKLEKPIILRSIAESNAAEEFYITDDKLEKWKYLKGAKKIERVAKTGFAYTFSEGPVAFPDSLDLPARTMLTSEATVNRSSHVVRDKEGNLRTLSPIECERLNGFPDGWTEMLPEKYRYFTMGNALVVPMITRMGKIIDEIVEHE